MLRGCKLSFKSCVAIYKNYGMDSRSSRQSVQNDTIAIDTWAESWLPILQQWVRCTPLNLKVIKISRQTFIKALNKGITH